MSLCLSIKNLILKLGAEGFISYLTENNSGVFYRQHYPALSLHPLDVAGAGDALLAAISVAKAKGLCYDTSSLCGAIAASIAVERVGNVPICLNELLKTLQEVIETKHVVM